MTGRPWTDDEIGFLQDHADWPTRRVAEELGRTEMSVKRARHKLKHGEIGRNLRVPWTEDEDSILVSAGPWITSTQLAAVLPGRTAVAVKRRRRELDLKVLAGGHGGSPFSTAGRPLVAKTCTACGLLLAGSWFHRTQSRGRPEWASQCRKCDAARSEQYRSENPDSRSRAKDAGRQASEAWRARAQSITRARAARHGEPYTEIDHQVLADPDLTNMQKALRLGRTWSAVTRVCRESGHNSRRDGLGDPERDVWVIDNPNLLMEASA